MRLQCLIVSFYRTREINKILANEYLEQGEISKATKCFNKCVDVTSAMALELIKVCRVQNIDCIVAPFEADAQLAYLALKGMQYIVHFTLKLKECTTFFCEFFVSL